VNAPRASSARAAVLLAFAGAAIAFGGTVSYFLVFARVPVLRDVPWVNLPLAAAGILLAAWGLWRSVQVGVGWGGRIGAGLAVALAFLFGGFLFVYVFWISYQVPGAAGVASMHEAAPDVTLTAMDGSRVELADYRGRKVLLVFYRGFW
jgi:hypothetical protein